MNRDGYLNMLYWETIMYIVIFPKNSVTSENQGLPEYVQ